MAIARPHFPDLLFAQTARLRAWETALATLFSASGYSEVSPSLVMESTRADSVRCIDGDRIVGLRWDFTEALAALFAARQDPPPGRVSYRGAVFRKPVHPWEPVERFEVGVECISDDARTSPLDRDILTLLLAVPACVGLRGAVLQLGSAALLALPLRAEGVDVETARAVANWLSKRAPHRVYDALKLHAGASKLVRHAECLLAGDVNASPYADLLGASIDELAATATFAREAMPPNVSLNVDAADVAGFGFYTGPTLRLWAPHAAFELGAGGRYDGLYPSLGKPWRAAGFCIRLARLLDLADAHPELFDP
jgi:ATP phosphoribosyltransferase regulatory subunit